MSDNQIIMRMAYEINLETGELFLDGKFKSLDDAQLKEEKIFLANKIQEAHEGIMLHKKRLELIPRDNLSKSMLELSEKVKAKCEKSLLALKEYEQRKNLIKT